MSTLTDAALRRVDTALNSFTTTIIDLPIDELGKRISSLIEDVGRLHNVTIGDLKIYGRSTLTGTASGIDAPKTMREAIKNGTKFFDAVYYFAAADKEGVVLRKAIITEDSEENMITNVKMNLLWMAIYLMIRGGLPKEDGTTVGKDIPQFLNLICGMKIGPLTVASNLASFEFEKIDNRWIKSINWHKFAIPVKNRLALGLAGYRNLGPFKNYNLTRTVDAEVLAAYTHARHLAQLPPSWDWHSATRDSTVVARYGSANKSLGNLMLECFTTEQLNEMIAVRLIYGMPVKDVRSDNWRTWGTLTPFEPKDFIKFDNK